MDLDKFGPVADLPEEFKEHTNNRPENTQTNNSNKRKDITPNKTDAKKTKEDNEHTNTTTDKQKDEDNNTEEDIAATASASMDLDTDIELVAEVIKNKTIRVTMILNMFLAFLMCSLNLTMQIISNTFLIFKSLFNSAKIFPFTKRNKFLLPLTWTFKIYKSTKRKLVMYLIISSIFSNNANTLHYSNDNYQQNYTNLL